MIFQKRNIATDSGGATWDMDPKTIPAQLEKIKKNQADLARYLGWKESAVSKLVNGKRSLKTHEADRILQFLGAAGGTYAKPSNMDVRRVDTPPAIPTRYEMPMDVPILGTAWGGESGDFTMNGETGAFARRPPRYEGRADIFALYVQGNSMEPRYFAGELILVEKRRPPQNGDNVVVELHAGPDGTSEAYLKVLVARTPTKIRLRQYNPPKEIEIDWTKVSQVLRVLTTADLVAI